MLWAKRKSAKDLTSIPEYDSVKIRPKLTAGLAKEVDEVKKYADAIQSEMSVALRSLEIVSQ